MGGAILDQPWYFVDSHVLLILKCPQQRQAISCKIRKCFLSGCKRKFTGRPFLTPLGVGSGHTVCAFGCGCRHHCGVLSWTHFVLL